MNFEPNESNLLYGDLLCLYLEAIGVKCVFGIPGGAIESFYNALARSSQRGGLKHILMRHETSAAFAAQGYFEQTGKIAVITATTGPGTTNLITGVASAYTRETPMIVISAQTRLETFGKWPLQDSSSTGVDTIKMLDACTRYNALISHVSQVETQVLAAIQTAFGHPQGPVHLSIPRNLLDQPLTMDSLTKMQVNLEKIDFQAMWSPKSIIDLNGVRDFLEMIEKNHRSVLLVGGKCSKAINQLVQFVELLDMPVITTPKGKSCFPNQHPNYYGVFGMSGHQSTKDLLHREDVKNLIFVGDCLSEFTSDGWNPILYEKNIIHIDESENHFLTTPTACLHVLSSIPIFFDQINARLKERIHKSVAKNSHQETRASTRIQLDDPEAIKNDGIPYLPQRLVVDLVEILPANTFFIADAGNSFAWALHYLFPKEVNNLYFTMNWCSMGCAYGYAIGLKKGNPNKPTVCFVGDGSFLMLGGEFSTAVQEKLPIIYIVLNDHSLGMVKHGQQLSGAEKIATALPDVDFAAIGKAMGGGGYRVQSSKELLEIDFDEILKGEIPVVIDALIDQAQIPPMGSRIKSLNKKWVTV